MKEYECDGTIEIGFDFESLGKPFTASALKKKIMAVIEKELEDIEEKEREKTEKAKEIERKKQKKKK